MPGHLKERLLLNPDFHDMLFALCEEKAEFLIVGAYALAVYGHPRATGAIDVWIRRSDNNPKRVWRALVRFGAPLADLKLEDLKTPDLIFQIGVEPPRIDIVTSITGIEFDKAWPDRKEVEIGGLKIPVIGRSHLRRTRNLSDAPRTLPTLPG
jgi:hypothetical protein